MKESWKQKKKIIVLSALFFIIGLFFVLQNREFAKYEEINVRPLFVGGPDEPDGEKTFSSPISGNYQAIIVAEDRPASVFLNFREAVSFDGFSVFFKGDLVSANSYLAEDFDVYYKDRLGEWKKIDEVRGNRSSVYQFYSPTTLSSNSINLSISKAAFFNIVVFGDLRFYEKHSLGLIEGIKNFFFEQRKSLLAYLFYSFLFSILLLLPGYTVLDLVKRRETMFENGEYKIVFAPIVSIIILFLIALLYLLFGDLNILNFYWLVFIISCFIFLKRRLYREVISSKFLLLSIGAFILITVLIQAHRDYLFNLQYIEMYLDKLEFIPLRGGYFGYFGDNIRQWRIAKLLLHKIPISGEQTEGYLMGSKPGEIFDRTPLLFMITTVILRMFGESHFVYQRFLNILAAFYYGAIYLLLKKYFSEKVAKVGSLLALLNVPLTFLTINAEIYHKYFAILPMFLAFTLFLKEKNEKSFWIGILVGISFLIHPMALLFSLVLVCLYLARYRLTTKFFKKATVVFGLLVLLVLTWVLVSQYLKFKAGIVEKNRYWQEMTDFNREMVKNKLANFGNLFMTNILLEKPEGGAIRLMSSDFWIPFLRFSIITNLTPLMFIAFLAYLKKGIKKSYEILLMALLPFAIYILSVNTYMVSWYFNMIYPFSIPCLLGYITSEVIKKKKAFKLLIFGSYSFFMLISLYFVDGVFAKMKYLSLVIWSSAWGIILLYIVLSLFLIREAIGVSRKVS